MGDIASMHLCGRLTKDPVRPDNAPADLHAIFTIAVNTGSGDRRQTSFFDCESWGHTGRFIAQYARKGSWIYVSGRPYTRTFEQNGERRTAFRLKVFEAELPPLGQGSSERASSSEPPSGGEDWMSDVL